MTSASHADLRQGIVETCREMNRNGLNQGTSGNRLAPDPRRHADHADLAAL